MQQRRPTATTGRRARVAVAIVSLALAVPAVGALAATSAAQPLAVDDCLARAASSTTVSPAGDDTKLRETTPPDRHTFDLRATTYLGNQDSASSDYNPTPLNIGTDSTPDAMCIVGAHVVGTQSRDLDWEYLKHDPGGGDRPALRVGGNVTIDGLRVDNMMNGVRPFSDGMTLRNTFFEYIRDDCVANDSLYAMRIEDSYFNGCYTAFSARPEKGSPLWNQGRDTSLTEIDRTLIHLKPMPGGFRITDPGVSSYDHLWKWSSVAGPVEIRDSIIMVEQNGTKNYLSWPANITATNVTIVWAGSGDYPGDVPPGATLTRDTSIWQRATTDWLARHGCTGVNHCDVDQLVHPDGASSGSTTTSDTTTTTTTPSTTTTASMTAPTNVTATVVNGGVRLTWDAVDGAQEYRVRRDAGDGGQTYSGIAQVPAGEPLEHLDTTVNPGTTYQYRVAAVAGTDGAISDAVSVAVPLPPASPVVEITLRGRSADITWGPTAGADSYRLLRTTNTAKWTTEAVFDGPGGGSFQDSHLDRKTTYHYLLRAINAAGSTDSKEVTIMVAN